jgi:hypothetical protein
MVALLDTSQERADGLESFVLITAARLHTLGQRLHLEPLLRIPLAARRLALVVVEAPLLLDDLRRQRTSTSREAMAATHRQTVALGAAEEGQHDSAVPRRLQDQPELQSVEMGAMAALATSSLRMSPNALRFP